MKSIEEREDNFAKREVPHNNGTALWRDGYREGLKVGYHFGAIEQKAKTLLKRRVDGINFLMLTIEQVNRFNAFLDEIEEEKK